MQPDSRLVEEVVRRIVEVAHPARIFLFGSAARGEMGPRSDLDVLVVMPKQSESRDVDIRLSRSLTGLDASVDVIVATEDDLERLGDNWSLVYYWALREGREIYAAGSTRAG